MTNWKPTRYNSASPYLTLNDPLATMTFLVSLFGAQQLRRYERPDGSIMHLEVLLDDTVIMIGGAMDEWPEREANIHVYVPDVDAAYQRALASGAVSVQEPVRKGDEDKRGGVKFASVTWWLATMEG